MNCYLPTAPLMGWGMRRLNRKAPPPLRCFLCPRDAFPDLHVTVEDVFGEDDRVVARCTVRGTHQGHGIGIAPTNAAVCYGGMCILRFEEGRIVEAWNSFDLHTLYQQIEAAEAAQQTSQPMKSIPATSAAARSVLYTPD